MEPTNVLVIMSDQHAHRAMGCAGDPIIQTPNLDALAARGTRFTSAITPTPICVPARASFATGRYPHTIDAWDNAAPYTGGEAPSWGHRLLERGHHVTTVGKLHYRDASDPAGFPDQRIPMHVLDGLGDRYALLRERMPTRPQSRRQVIEAGAGETSYIRYDREIARTAADWLGTEATGHDHPWALFVSFVTPHFPLVVPETYLHRYPLEDVPMPVNWHPDDWPRHPVLERQRAWEALDEPFDEVTIRRAIAAYYGLVTFLDEQIGIVLDALTRSRLAETTRVIYVSDHGEMLGNHGLWWKSSMYDASVGIPCILAGPDVPAGRTVTTNVSLVDLFPTIVAGVGAALTDADQDLPGMSLWPLAAGAHHERTVFSEYHTIFSTAARYLLRDDQSTYVHYVDGPPHLFDRRSDPDERVDLAPEPESAGRLASYEARLRALLDPVAVDHAAKADQRRRLDAAGGADAVLAGGVTIPYTPAPGA